MVICYDKSRLMYGNISLNYSPNFSRKKRIKKNIKFIIFHYTGMSSESKAINRLTDDKVKVSCHYFIKKNGTIMLMVPEIYIAWHAGKSNWKKCKSLNKLSIGIEIQNKGHELGYQSYKKAQIKSVLKLSSYLMKKYKISKKNILGHSDIAYERKNDPGEKFPWEYLAKKNIGNWHNLSQKKIFKLRNLKLDKYEQNEFFNYLVKIGYFVNVYYKQKKKLLIKAFQRRYRPELINGKIDVETLIIAQKLSKI